MKFNSWVAAVAALIWSAAHAQSTPPPAASSAAATPPALPAIDTMSPEALATELSAARPLVANGGVQPFRPSGCTNAESRQFDFWLGEWDVSPTGKDFNIGENSITLHARGCVVLETWRPFAGASGMSINTWDPVDQMWHQEFVSAGARRTPYAGRFADGVMTLDTLSAPPAGSPPGFKRRMRFQKIDDNTVRQWGEAFRDGKWSVTWDLTYRRRAGTRPD